MARWARLELATDGLENRCSVRLSYHRTVNGGSERETSCPRKCGSRVPGADPERAADRVPYQIGTPIDCGSHAATGVLPMAEPSRSRYS
jgi:hypothetical protein